MIPSTYAPKDVTPKKSEKDRTLESARAVVAGQLQALKRIK